MDMMNAVRDLIAEGLTPEEAMGVAMKNAAPKTTNARLTPMSDQERLDANNARKHAQKLRRIERAKEMIARGLPAEEIAEELGYRLATYERFCRDNRLVPLKTPGAKRKAANG